MTRLNYEIVPISLFNIMICALSGLWSGLIIGYITDFFTSNSHFPTKNLAISCKSGAAINIIDGLALGYLSCVLPILIISSEYKNFLNFFSYNIYLF